MLTNSSSEHILSIIVKNYCKIIYICKGGKGDIMRNWELIFVKRISGEPKNKKNRIVFNAEKENAEKKGKQIYKETFNIFQRIFYTYEIH